MEFESYASNQIYIYAKRYGIKATPISYEDSLILLEYKGKKELIKQTATHFTTIIQGRICDNKYLALKILRDNGIHNVPRNLVIENIKETKKITIPYPLVVKPLKGHGGVGVSIGIKNKKEITNAFLEAKKICPRVLVEECVSGEDYRFLVIDKKVRICKRMPPMIIGNAKKSIQSLIYQENTLRKKIDNLTDIKIDNELQHQIQSQGYTLTSILPRGKQLVLRKNANLSTGGTTIDCTNSVHSTNKKLALNIAKIMGMKIIAIDFMFKDPTQPYSKDNGMVIEINDTPGLRLHHPKEKEIVYSIFKLLFPALK